MAIQNLDPVHSRHRKVEKDKVETLLLQAFEGLPAVCGQNCAVVQASEPSVEELKVAGIVVDGFGVGEGASLSSSEERIEKKMDKSPLL